MSYTIQRTLEARADLQGIARYTHEMWGKKQLQVYMAELDTTIQELMKKPITHGQDRKNIKEGLRALSHKKHYHIFYRVKGDTVEVLRILHQRSNWQRMMLGLNPFP